MLRSREDLPTRLVYGYRGLTSLRNAFAFRRIFSAPGSLTRALVQMTADDRFELYLNGRKILENHETDGWRNPQAKDITDLLQPGTKNILAGYYRNLGGPGGMLLELTMLDGQGKPSFIFTDHQFKGGRPDAEGAYLKLDFDDRDWSPMVSQLPPPGMPWARTLNYIDIVPYPELQARLLPASEPVPAGSQFRLQLQGQGICPAPGRQLTVNMKTHDGILVDELKYVLKKDMIRTGADGWTIVIPLPLPLWFSTPAFIVRVAFRDYRLPAGKNEIRLPVIPRRPGKASSYRVKKNSAGMPQIFVDGRPVYAMIGNSDRALDRTGFDQVPMGFRTVWYSNSGFWTGDKQYCYSALDKDFQKVLQHDPETPVIVWFGCEAPLWWGKKYPGELMRFNDGTNWDYRVATPSFSSRKFREDAGRMLQAALDYCVNRAPYRDRIAGFSINCGYSHEWQNWACHAAKGLYKLSDYSRPQQEGFAGFLQKEYPDLAAAGQKIPSFARRLKPNGADIFCPEDTRRMNLAYNDYLSRSVVGLMQHFFQTARSTVGPDRLLGCYYGYTLEYPNLGWALQLSGHYALQRVLQMPEVDFLMSPPSYGVRCIGDCGEDMKPFASIREAGKISLVDDDTRTDMTDVLDFFQTVNRKQTRQVLRRNFGRCLARMEPVCVFALGEGIEFAAPETVSDLKRFRKISEVALSLGACPNADVAVVVSERAHLMMGFQQEQRAQGVRQWYNAQGRVSRTARMVQPTVGESVSYQRCRLAASGFSYDFILAEDLPRVADRPYKLWIFLNAFNPDDEFVRAAVKIRQSSATLLWLRAPGVFHAGHPADDVFRKKLTGFDLQKLTHPAENILVFADGSRSGNEGLTAPLFQVKPAPGIRSLAEFEALPGQIAAAELRTGASRSVFYSGEVLKPEFLRKIALEAGVHVYASGNDVLYANTHFLTFHAATAGRKTVTFPEVCDVVDAFSGERLATQVKQWHFQASLHETKVVFFGHAADFAR